MEVKQIHLDLAHSVGACADGLGIAVGTAISNMRSSHLNWFEEHFPFEAKVAAESVVAGVVARGVPPLVLLGDGYGGGDSAAVGYGYGDGGYGDGGGGGGGGIGSGGYGDGGYGGGDGGDGGEGYGAASYGYAGAGYGDGDGDGEGGGGG